MTLVERLNNINDLTSRSDIDKLFEELYKAYGGLVGFVASTYFKDENVIKDVINESFFKLYLNRTNVRNIKSFLTTCARNLCLDELRKSNKVIPFGDYIELFSNPEEANNEEARELIFKIKKLLNEEEIKLFTMHILEGFPLVNIAREWNINESTIRSKWHRIVVKLRLKIKYYEK